MPSTKTLDKLAIDTIRALTMDAVEAANSGHPGAPMGLAPLGWVLFSRILRFDPATPSWPDRDRFVLSAGHASMLQYALLHLTGYDLRLEELREFRQLGSRTPGHPEVGQTPGVETTTGPLGQGIANAVGMAMAERHLAQRFNRPGHRIVDHRTYVIVSDGDLMEGISSEAASLAGHLRLHKLTVFWDDNRITIDGPRSLSFSEDVLSRFRAFGWNVLDVEDGEDLEAIERAAKAAQSSDRPTFVRVHTCIGYPAPTKGNQSACHGAPLGADEVRRTKDVLGVPQEPFFVPSELHAVREKLRAAGTERTRAWTDTLRRYEAAHPEDARAFCGALERTLVEGWERDLPAFPPDKKGMPTRKASGVVLTALAARIPELVGGSADLAGSNQTYLSAYPAFDATDDGALPPRNVHFGIREHAMAAACNGMALHGGVRPFAATFLIFSDYLRPSMRLAALMELPVRYVFTHDSIGVGEDGPTHQPVDQLASLRAIPGLWVLRPCDANEVRECWKVALGYHGPAALVLTRQDLPVLDRASLAPAEYAANGAYVLREAEGSLDVILVATGSEVPLALSAQGLLQRKGIGARVVSMPSWELFAAQPEGYQHEVLPPKVRTRVAIEAASRMGWARWVGLDGEFVTMDQFGVSAPATVLFEHFGFTPECVAQKAEALLERHRQRQPR